MRSVECKWYNDGFIWGIQLSGLSWAARLSQDLAVFIKESKGLIERGCFNWSVNDLIFVVRSWLRQVCYICLTVVIIKSLGGKRENDVKLITLSLKVT